MSCSHGKAHRRPEGSRPGGHHRGGRGLRRWPCPDTAGRGSGTGSCPAAKSAAGSCANQEATADVGQMIPNRGTLGVPVHVGESSPAGFHYGAPKGAPKFGVRGICWGPASLAPEHRVLAWWVGEQRSPEQLGRRGASRSRVGRLAPSPRSHLHRPSAPRRPKSDAVIISSSSRIDFSIDSSNACVLRRSSTSGIDVICLL